MGRRQMGPGQMGAEQIYSGQMGLDIWVLRQMGLHSVSSKPLTSLQQCIRTKS